MWDARTGAEALTLKGHTGQRRLGVAFSPDGTRVVTAGEDKTARVWDARTGAEALTLKGHAGNVASAAFSPDGARRRHRGDDGTAKVWDARDGGRGPHASRGTPADVDSASFSPDGARVVTAGQDGTARVWDARTGAEALTLKGHTDSVMPRRRSAPTGPASSPPAMTGRRGCGTRGRGPRPSRSRGTPVPSARRRSAPMGPASSPPARRGEAVGREEWGRAPLIRGAGITSAAFSADGSRVVTADSDGTARVWDAAPISREFLASGPASPPEAAK